jgi:multidrug transporter EmrE-like cation transporter
VYAWGIVFALLAGVASQAGHICQKLVVNAEADGRGGFFTRLLRRPLWLAGLVLEIGLSTVFFLLAQVRLGPALIPGLMATGLIVLAVGSARIVREALSLGELLGIILLIASAVLLGSSRLAIDLSSFDIFEHGFLGRAALFSAAVTALFFALRLGWRSPRFAAGAGRGAKPAIRGALTALGSGLLYVLSNFWVGPFTGAVLRLFRGELGLPVWAMFAFGSAALVLTNLFGIAELQRAFRVSRAAVAVPLQTLPTQVAPGLVYLLVFRLPPPSRAALWLFALGAGLILISSFLLGRRQPGEARSSRRGRTAVQRPA